MIATPFRPLKDTRYYLGVFIDVLREQNHSPENVRKVMHELMGQPSGAPQRPSTKPPKRCAAGRDGDCIHAHCPQLKDGEPTKSGRHCPLDKD